MSSIPLAALRGGAAIVATALVAATGAVELQAQQPPPAWKQGQPASMADSKLAPHASPMTVTPAEKIDAQQAQGAGRLQGGAVGARHARRAHDGARRQGHDLHRHARDRQGLRGDRQGRQAHQQGDRRRPAAAQRRGLQERLALRDDASTRRCASTASRTSSTRRSRPTSARPSSCRRRRTTTGSSRPSAPTTSSTSRSARPATSARSTLACTARSAGRTSTAPASRSWPAACATRWASTGTRRPRSCGSPTTAATGRATTGPEDELNRVPATPSARLLRLPLLPRQRHPRSRDQAPEPVRRRDPACRHARARMRPRSACASTPATCSRPTTRTTPSSPGAARGTAPRSSAMTWCWPRSTAARRPSRRS